jgi:hypothetical protein
VRTHYGDGKRPLRRCHARDLMEQVMYFCSYNEVPTEINTTNLDRAVKNYFTALATE